MAIVVRELERRDAPVVARLRAALWPDAPADALAREVEDLLDGRPGSTLPCATLVAVDGDEVLGFAEVGLRSHADGCDPARPVGFLEGWFVRPEVRRQGVGRALVAAAEAWARAQGAREFASDTWADNEASIRAHLALGFEVVDRCVTFRKELGG
ncbi:MAG: GNAT family N-acetyltransferase [Planctomycetes bacterium]|nr:GNAT family N-acetyltransferase [Planctomycetota bacterium]